jgi:hypothetical protein
MAAKAPGVIRHGTPRDLADHGVGYTASGASEHTRESAHGKTGGTNDTRVTYGGKVWRERVTAKASAVADYNRQQAIKIVQSELENLRRAMKTETSPARLARFEKHFAERQANLAHLQRPGR